MEFIRLESSNGFYKCEGYKEKQFRNNDIYRIDEYSSLSTKQYSICVDFEEKEITGDVVAHGDWYDIDLEECFPLLDFLKEKNHMGRDFTEIYESLKSKK